ncbi:proline-rich protein 12-like [Portunus trituberculatus]|uniref:proline-rich protein 12-like n=1 Tax=Portunus trituberculatus TaxID=210409 RepID=UPI001E1D11FA|nr:proline-rich protein 12-like [Portunus trituberculatus]
MRARGHDICHPPALVTAQEGQQEEQEKLDHKPGNHHTPAQDHIPDPRTFEPGSDTCLNHPPRHSQPTASNPHSSQPIAASITSNPIPKQPITRSIEPLPLQPPFLMELPSPPIAPPPAPNTRPTPPHRPPHQHFKDLPFPDLITGRSGVLIEKPSASYFFRYTSPGPHLPLHLPVPPAPTLHPPRYCQVGGLQQEIQKF